MIPLKDSTLHSSSHSQEFSGPSCPQSLNLLPLAHSGSQELAELPWAPRAAEGSLWPLSWLYLPLRKSPNCIATLLAPEWRSWLKQVLTLHLLSVSCQAHSQPFFLDLGWMLMIILPIRVSSASGPARYLIRYLFGIVDMLISLQRPYLLVFFSLPLLYFPTLLFFSPSTFPNSPQSFFGRQICFNL